MYVDGLLQAIDSMTELKNVETPRRSIKIQNRYRWVETLDEGIKASESRLAGISTSTDRFLAVRRR
jgi:hypothetical protein